MKKTKSIILSSILFTIAALIIISAQYSINPENVEAQSAATSTPVTRLTGYAWSENIGWISFKDGTVPVKVEANGNLVGYAWSENIGWIQFGGLAGIPSTSYESNSQARLSGSTFSGWARAVAGMSGLNRGGWDGWIALKGVTIQLRSVALAATPAPAFVSGCTSANCANGAAWGSDVIGWIDFSGVTTVEQRLSCTGSYGTIPDGSSLTFFSTPDVDGNCTSQQKECVNGVLTPNDPSLTQFSCGDDDDDDDTNKVCTRAGRIFKSGEKVVFYSKPIAGAGQVCENFMTELTCTDGKFYRGTPPVLDDGTVSKHPRCISNPSYKEL